MDQKASAAELLDAYKTSLEVASRAAEQRLEVPRLPVEEQEFVGGKLIELASCLADVHTLQTRPQVTLADLRQLAARLKASAVRDIPALFAPVHDGQPDALRYATRNKLGMLYVRVIVSVELEKLLRQGE